MMETKSQNDCKTKKECSYCFECVYVCMCMCWRDQKKKKSTHRCLETRLCLYANEKKLRVQNYRSNFFCH